MQELSRALRHLAIIALLMRAMLPAGWMPDAQAGITICSATPKSEHHQQDVPARHDICPFAATPQLAATPDAPQLSQPALHAVVAPTDRHYAAAILAHFTPQSPRAPPLFA